MNLPDKILLYWWRTFHTYMALTCLPFDDLPGSFLDYTKNTSIGSAMSMACGSNKREKRKVPTNAEKILDAPCIVDDYCELFYNFTFQVSFFESLRTKEIKSFVSSTLYLCSDLNVLDWSRNNQVVIALGPTVYLWNPANGCTTELLEVGEEGDGSYVSSLSFAEKGKYLAIGTHSGDIQVGVDFPLGLKGCLESLSCLVNKLWDLVKEKRVRTMKGHVDRVASLHWNSHTLAR